MQTNGDKKMIKQNKYQIDTLLWNGRYGRNGWTDLDSENITFEIMATSEANAWVVGDDYMNNNYNQELHNADTTITKVGA